MLILKIFDSEDPDKNLMTIEDLPKWVVRLLDIGMLLAKFYQAGKKEE